MDQPSSFQSQPTTLTGVVERITFTNSENGYTVARFQADKQFGLVTIVGPLAEVHPGARLKLFGRWKTHAKYGDQFEIERYESFTRQALGEEAFQEAWQEGYEMSLEEAVEYALRM